MSISIKGQKFLGNDLELIEFIQKDLKNFYDEVYKKYFLKKEVAIKIGECIKLYIKKDAEELQALKLIYESGDMTLSKQKKIIEKNKSLERAIKRLALLNQVEHIENYLDLMRLLQEYYKLKDYSTLVDIKYLSLQSQIIIFFYDGNYTSLQTDREKLFIDFILSNKKFIDFSFDFNETEDENNNSKFSVKELNALIEKENIWKSIYALITSNEEHKTQIATTFYFDVIDSLQSIYGDNNFNELLSLAKQNIK